MFHETTYNFKCFFVIEVTCTIMQEVFFLNRASTSVNTLFIIIFLNRDVSFLTIIFYGFGFS